MLIGLPTVVASTVIISSMNEVFFVQNIPRTGISLMDFHFHLTQHLNHFLFLQRRLDFTFGVIQNMLTISKGFLIGALILPY